MAKYRVKKASHNQWLVVDSFSGIVLATFQDSFAAHDYCARRNAK